MPVMDSKPGFPKPLLIGAVLIGLALALYAGMALAQRSAPKPARQVATMDQVPAPVATPTAHAVGSASAYAFCAACHRPDGKGMTGLFPPLIGSRLLLGDPQQAVALVLNGLDSRSDPQAPRWSSHMLPLNHLSDQMIADALSHARSSWGNQASAITADQVAAVRARCASRGKPWTPAELPQVSQP